MNINEKIINLKKQGTKSIPELEGLIEYHRNKYYNEEPEISDADFDSLFDLLSELDPENQLIQKTGTEIAKDSPWEKAKHKMKMFSLSKIHTPEECQELFDTYKGSYLMQEKLDGSSIELCYKGGKLVQAITRGDGYVGEDITRNVMKMKNVKSTVSCKDEFSLRGEIVLRQDDFEVINKLRFENDESELINLRNGANGTAKRFDGKYSEYLSLLYYDVENRTNPEEFQFEEDKLNFIVSLGLIPVQYKMIETPEEAYQYYLDYIKNRLSLDHDIDGMVIKLNDCVLSSQLDDTIPKTQKAWKFPNAQLECQVLDINWQLKQGEKINPVASLKSLFVLLPDGSKQLALNSKHVQKILGAKINNVTLNNLEWINEKNLGLMDVVVVERANDVIPKLIKVVKKSGLPIKIPDVCPRCGQKTTIEGRFLCCKNPDCPAKTMDILLNWIEALDIQDIGNKTVVKFHELGMVNEPADFYKLEVQRIAEIEGMGEIMGNKIISQFNNKKELSLVEFLVGLAINNCKRKTTEKLIESGYDTLDRVRSLTVEEIAQIKGFAEKTAEVIVKGLQDRSNIINNLLEYVSIKSIEKKQVGDKLKGLSFCITGTLSKKREEIERIIKDNGGSTGGVSKKLSYLIVGTEPGSKLYKAQQLEVKVINELQFEDLLK
jgi:DNA ligase (NAD+)